ncbi:MAG: hypothetical protein V1494_05725 [Candidatus Diapherotrites archaeon]
MGFFVHKALLAFACVLAIMACGSALAADFSVSGFPATVSFYAAPKDISFTVKNDSNSIRSLSVDFFVPVEVKFLELPDFIGAGEEAQVKARLFPKEELIGSKYNSRAVIFVGAEKAEKTLRLNFFAAEKCMLDLSIAKKETDVNGLHDINLLIQASNPSLASAKLELLELKGLPSDWGYSIVGGEKKVSVEAQGNSVIEIDLIEKSAFDGNVSAILSCDGFRAGQTVSVKHESSESGAGLMVLSGLASFFTSELALDIFLALIASILLIAFLARLVKRVAVK